MRTQEEGPVFQDEARMERLHALYERYCRAANADQADLASRSQDVAAVPCKLAPTVLRRAANLSPR